MNKCKAMIFPYNAESTPLVKYAPMLENFEIKALVSLKGWAMGGQDAGAADGGDPLGISVSDDFEQALDGVDAVIVSDIGVMYHSFDNKHLEKTVLDKVLRAIEAGKTIALLLRLTEDNRNILREAAERNHVLFLDYSLPSPVVPESVPSSLHRIGVPVVFVAGIHECTDKFYAQLGLRDYFLKNGYRTVSIGSRSYCELLGFHSFPDFMLGNNFYSNKQKILLFNQYIFDIQNTQKPDLIVLGIPGGVMPLDPTYTSDFGTLAYMVSNAVCPDYTVLCTFYENLVDDAAFFDGLSELTSKRFGYPINAVNMSPFGIDWNIQGDTFVQYTCKDRTELQAATVRLQKLCADLPVLNLRRAEDVERLYQHITGHLSDERQVEIVNQNEFLSTGSFNA